MRLPRFIREGFKGFKVTDLKEWLSKGVIEIHLEKASKGQTMICGKCGCKLQAKRGKHRMNVKHLPIFNFECRLIFWREKGHCPECKKTRSEKIDFLSYESPHLSKEYSWWLGMLTEISTVSRVAELTGNDQNTLWRLDYDRLVKMLQNYEIPPLRKISVDEVHARSKKRYSREPRTKQYFTVISDLDTGRVVWVSDNREKEALDTFYRMIGEERCNQIEVVAMDQFSGFKASTEEFCPQAIIVWDRFHLMRNFENALNEERLEIMEKKKNEKKLIQKIAGQFKYIFLKKSKNRTKFEQQTLKEVMKENRDFYKLELIKEKFFQFFNQKTEDDARDILIDVKNWIKQGGFKYLQTWVDNFVGNWETVRNYFKMRVTSALSEGQNNVIKALKRRCFGFKNMMYFKLKIMQVCGYLNSKYIQIDTY